MTKLDFWYDLASTYSYLSAMRIGALAAERGVAVGWRPFLLGPIFGSQGWTTSPFNIYEAKGANMWRDMERLCAARGLPLVRPDPFPQNSLHAARWVLAADENGRADDLTRAIYAAEFGDGATISSAETLAALAEGVDLDASALAARVTDPHIKDRLKTDTAEAQSLGIFGAPTFVTASGELFWGDDRLEQALDWAVRE